LPLDKRPHCGSSKQAIGQWRLDGQHFQGYRRVCLVFSMAMALPTPSTQETVMHLYSLRVFHPFI
jgi:hypothetical protein